MSKQGGQIDISVCMISYYHRDYIAQAIESVLTQKTRYTFELVISDDCSKDGTADVLRQYEKRYPEIIRVNYNSENMGIPGNIFKARSMCKGRYIVGLSGDDYYIDCHKIERQARFLDHHPEFVAVFNRVELRVNRSDRPYDTLPRKGGKVYTLKNFEKGEALASHGFMMRNFFLEQEGRDYFGQARNISSYVDDAVDNVLILKKGPVYILDVATDAHRVIRDKAERHNYNSRYPMIEKFRHDISLYNEMDARWGDQIDFSRRYADSFVIGMIGMIMTRKVREYRSVFRSIPKKFRGLSRRSIYVRFVPLLCIRWEKT